MTSICPVCNHELQSDTVRCPLCGYKFKDATEEFQALHTLDKDTEFSGSSSAISSFEVVRGPQTGSRYTLERQSYTVGRNPQCDIFLNDMTVSRQHAVVEWSDGFFGIRDTGSYNGVWVNNQCVVSQRLQDKDTVQIGVFCLLFHEGLTI